LLKRAPHLSGLLASWKYAVEECLTHYSYYGAKGGFMRSYTHLTAAHRWA
jgi:hypothetical protein